MASRTSTSPRRARDRTLLLPCNIVVEQRDGRTHIAAVDPHQLMDDPRFAGLADEAATKLRAVIDAVAGS
jgi:uncharacterized protein (DUF302 family)